MTNTPTNVTSRRTGKNGAWLSWSAPASNTPPVAGYEVFYTEFGSDIRSLINMTSTSVTVYLPKLEIMYEFFVVAFSDAPNALPSARSIVSTVYLSTCKRFIFNDYKCNNLDS